MTAKANVKLIAMADAFEDSLEAALAASRTSSRIASTCPRSGGLPVWTPIRRRSRAGPTSCCSTPPGFRPMQFEAAVKAGKHVFMEKPLATDAPGIRRIAAANEEAKKKGLAVAVGHHLRHETKHREIIEPHP